MDNQNGQWVTLDSTVPESKMGWRPDNITRDRKWGSMTGLGSFSPRVQRIMAMRQSNRPRTMGNSRSHNKNHRSMGDVPQCDTSTGDFYIDENGNCQPVNVATTIDQVGQTFLPALQPLINAAAYRKACSVGPFIDAQCAYNPNQTNVNAKFNYNSASGTNTFAGLNISSSTLLYGGAALLGFVILAKTLRGGRR
jgi:hypothetical protein